MQTLNFESAPSPSCLGSPSPGTCRVPLGPSCPRPFLVSPPKTNLREGFSLPTSLLLFWPFSRLSPRPSPNDVMGWPPAPSPPSPSRPPLTLPPRNSRPPPRRPEPRGGGEAAARLGDPRCPSPGARFSMSRPCPHGTVNKTHISRSAVSPRLEVGVSGGAGGGVGAEHFQTQRTESLQLPQRKGQRCPCASVSPGVR